MRVLGIETSCDETAAAVVDGNEIRSSVVASQADRHAPFGGVVPELASRAHAEVVSAVVRRALADAGSSLGDVDGIAVTTGPGLVGCLLVGISAAKTLAWAAGKPLVAVDHIEGHVDSVRLEHPDLPTPCATLVVSGGHTSLYRVDRPGQLERLGATRDDAAGEAFDKVAALLGLGYPGGPKVERAAAGGDRRGHAFPRPLLDRTSLDFSFSGLKTAVLYESFGQDGRRGGGSLRPGVDVADVCASFQEAIVDVLVVKLLRAADAIDAAAMAIAGGVACNGRLRERLAAAAAGCGRPVYWPRPSLCTDNAAMIAGLGHLHLAAGRTTDLDLDAAA